MAQNRHWDQDRDSTIYFGNVDERAEPKVVYEVLLQAGPIDQPTFYMPKDRVTNYHQGFGFASYFTSEDAEYATLILNGIRLFGKPLRINKASADKGRTTSVGAKLWIGNLSDKITDEMLWEMFSSFGPPLFCRVDRDWNTGDSKGYGFVTYNDFEASDRAIENLNGEEVLGQALSVEYAKKRDGNGEKHGNDAERKLASEAKRRNMLPESQQQPAPTAFLNNRGGVPSGGAPPPGPISASSSMPRTPSLPAGFGTPNMQPPTMPSMHSMPTISSIPSFSPMSSLSSVNSGYMPPYQQRPPRPPPGFGTTHHTSVMMGGGGGGGSMQPPPSMGGEQSSDQSLAPLPSGLPARPPQGQSRLSNPADFHPRGGFRRPPSTGPPGQPGFTPPIPPSGFTTPPPGFGKPGQASGPPPGFPMFNPPPGLPVNQN